MLLTKAGVEFEDVRLTQDSFKELKESGVLENGQVPMVELDDGTRLFQCDAILNYFAKMYGMFPQDPTLCYHGEATLINYSGDFKQKMSNELYATPSDQMVPVYEKWTGEKFEAWMASFEKRLTKGKFICGDDLTVFDIQVGGFFTDMVLNKNNKGAVHWAAAMEKAPQRVLTYVADFQAALGDYITNRPESAMGI